MKSVYIYGNAYGIFLPRIPTRGHCVVWGVENNVPDWVKPLDGNQVRAEVSTRVQGVVDRMRGRYRLH